MADVHGEIVLLNMIPIPLAELRVEEVNLMALPTAVYVFFPEQLQSDTAAEQLSMDVSEVWHDWHRLSNSVWKELLMELWFHQLFPSCWWKWQMSGSGRHFCNCVT